MSFARYFLLRRNGMWLVTLEGRVMARCATRTEAIEAAATMADLMGSMHYDADVVVEADDGSGLEVVWSFGRDDVPRKTDKRGTAAVHPHIRLVQRGELAAATGAP